jgi:hypothetical protein
MIEHNFVIGFGCNDLLYKTKSTRGPSKLVQSHDDSLDITTFPKQFMDLKYFQR